VPIDTEGVRGELQDPFRERGEHRRIRHLRHDDGEFVAGQARQQVAVPQRCFEALRRRLQKAVADRMAEGIVDRFEAVQVEHEQRGLVAVLLAAGESGHHELLELLPVRQSGEFVMQCEVTDRGVLGRKLSLAVMEAGHERDEGDHRHAAAEQHFPDEGSRQRRRGVRLIDAQRQPTIGAVLRRQHNPCPERPLSQPAKRIARIGPGLDVGGRCFVPRRSAENLLQVVSGGCVPGLNASTVPFREISASASICAP
jgi:hypothetical protein